MAVPLKNPSVAQKRSWAKAKRLRAASWNGMRAIADRRQSFRKSPIFQKCANSNGHSRRVVVRELGGAVTTYGYDAANRLTSEHRTGGANYRTTHTYDPVGSRANSTVGSW